MLVRMAITKKSTGNNPGEGVVKKESSYTVGKNVNWYSHYGEQYGGSLKKENRTSMWPSSPIPGHIIG